jgi:hypothetical protein
VIFNHLFVYLHHVNDFKNILKYFWAQMEKSIGERESKT